MTSSFLASNSSTSQLADIYRPLKNCACGEAKYRAAPAASSTSSSKINYVSLVVGFGKESEIGDDSELTYLCPHRNGGLLDDCLPYR